VQVFVVPAGRLPPKPASPNASSCKHATAEGQSLPSPATMPARCDRGGPTPRMAIGGVPIRRSQIGLDSREGDDRSISQI